MLDWKILAASVAALLVASTMLVGTSSAQNLGFDLNDFFKGIEDWLRSSPLGGLFQAPVASVYPVDIILETDHYEFRTGSDTNLTIDSINIINFNGDIISDFLEKTIVFSQSGTELDISMPLQNLSIDNIGIDKVFLENTRFVVTYNQLDTKGENASIEITDFSGQIIFRPSFVEMHGNVSMVRGNNKDII